MRRIDAFGILAILIFSTLKGVAADKTVAELAHDASPAVMVLHIKDSTGKEIAVGTGFVISPDGLLLTARHVIKSAAAAEAQASDRGIFRVVGLCGSDEANDLALLKLDASNLKCLELAATGGVHAGEKVVVIGSPLGLDGTVTDGIVSAVRDETGTGKRLQITAAISHGSSGSPVLNSEGKVIGIASFYLKDSQALNFAIPADLAARLEKEYRKLSAEESNRSNKFGDQLASPGIQPLPGTIAPPHNQTDYVKEIGNSAESEAYAKAVGAKDAQKKLITCQAIVKKYPNNPFAYALLGSALIDVGFLQEATDTIEAGLKLDNQSAILWATLGSSQEARWFKQERGFGERAAASFHRAILCDPEYAQAWYELANLLRLMGNKDSEALDAINNAIKIDSKNKGFLWLKGHLLLSADSNKEAYKLFKMLTDTYPSEASNWEGYGIAARKIGFNTEAENAARKAIDICDSCLDGWAVLADIYEASGRKRELASLWKEVDVKRPELRPMIQANLAALKKYFVQSSATSRKTN
jgi:tetratricopeptide (TPR) repeat protein